MTEKCIAFLAMGHVCFLSTAADDMKKSMTHPSVVSDGASIVHNGCQHTQSVQYLQAMIIIFYHQIT